MQIQKFALALLRAACDGESNRSGRSTSKTADSKFVASGFRLSPLNE